jgi:hypothetical protein
MLILSRTFNCQIGEMPFTYLGLPLGLARPRKEHISLLFKGFRRGCPAPQTFCLRLGAWNW